MRRGTVVTSAMTRDRGSLVHACAGLGDRCVDRPKQLIGELQMRDADPSAEDGDPVVGTRDSLKSALSGFDHARDRARDVVEREQEERRADRGAQPFLRYRGAARGARLSAIALRQPTSPAWAMFSGLGMGSFYPPRSVQPDAARWAVRRHLTPR